MSRPPPPCPSPLEIWGGIECSIVRLAGRVEDQLERTRHDRRLDDLDCLAELGIAALRYPILWERHARAPIDWSWADERLGRLRELGIRPIVGLVHHGAGPLPGGLLDPGFESGLADFAAKVATRYPWIDAYTPVNEPLTTARFCGMYGLWHPHGRSVGGFVRAFLQQCRGVRAAMRAVRAVNPRAQLVQTEDIGFTHSTRHLRYQADFENERRWMTFDLLSGRLAPGSPLWGYLESGGIAAGELADFRHDPCPPDLLGMNCYVTSERLLDERTQWYPREAVGGNGRERYADVPAVRARAEGLLGPAELLRQLAQRYRLPVAVTEIQLACTREEQVRWLMEFWAAAQAVRAEGVELRALTPWSLFGAYDWDSLLAHPRSHYENGAFDVRGPRPRRTLVGWAIAALARSGSFEHPVLDNPGWWRRPVRLEYPPVPAPAAASGQLPAGPDLRGRPLLIVGVGGRLSRALAELGHLRGLPVEHAAADELRTQAAVEARMATVGAWAVIDATAEAMIDAVDLHAPSPPLPPRVAPALAAACRSLGRPLLQFSSGLVFATPGGPWTERDRARPTHPWGKAQRRAERVAATHPSALIVRSGPWFSGCNDDDFISRVLRVLGTGRDLTLAGDQQVSPSHLPEVVNTALDLLLDGETGLWHLTNRGSTTPAEWARTLASLVGLPTHRLREQPAHQLAPAAWTFSPALASERGELLVPWEEALAGCLSQMERARTRNAEDVA